MADCVAAGVDGVELVATVCCLLAADTVDEDGAEAGAGARMAAGNLTFGFVWIVSLLALGCTAAGGGAIGCAAGVAPADDADLADALATARVDAVPCSTPAMGSGHGVWGNVDRAQSRIGIGPCQYLGLFCSVSLTAPVPFACCRARFLAALQDTSQPVPPRRKPCPWQLFTCRSESGHFPVNHGSPRTDGRRARRRTHPGTCRAAGIARLMLDWLRVSPFPGDAHRTVRVKTSAGVLRHEARGNRGERDQSGGRHSAGVGPKSGYFSQTSVTA